MRRSLFLAFIVCAMVQPFVDAVAQENPEAATVRSLELKLADCYKQRQVDTFASLLDEDFVITFEDGTTYGKTGYVSYTANTSTRVDVAEISDLKIRMHGDVAVLTGAYHEQGATKGEPYDYHDRFTDVWMKKSGKWRVVASHYSIPAKR